MRFDRACATYFRRTPGLYDQGPLAVESPRLLVSRLGRRPPGKPMPLLWATMFHTRLSLFKLQDRILSG